MLRTLYLKSVRDRWMGATIAVGALWLTAIWGMWAYVGIGDEAAAFFDQLPEFYSTLIGISSESGVTGLMMSMMFNFMGPFVVAGIAISMGAAAIAGEERDGTMNVLTTAPRSRSRLFGSKSAAVLTVAVLVNVALWGAYLATVAMFGESAAGVDILGATLHVLAVSLLYGALALAVGAATGQQRLASGVATAALVVSFFGAGLLPMIEGWEDWARVFPWYYINEAQPLINGADWAQLAVITAITLALVAAGWAGLIRRDLRDGEGRLPLVARLQDDARVARVLDLLRGPAKVRGLTGMAVSDSRALLVVAGGGMFAMMVAMGLLYPLFSDVIGEMVEAFPPEIMAMVGFADYTTPEGWYHGEGLSILAPVALGVVAISAGAALAGEERRRTIAMLFTAPVSRTRVAAHRAAAMVIASVLTAAFTVSGLAVGNWVSGLGIDVAHIAEAGVLLAGLGCVFGAVAFLAGAISGLPRAAIGAGTGIAVLGWALTAFAEVNDALEPAARLSPYYYATSGLPLTNGMAWHEPVVLFGAAAIMIVAGLIAYRRRDLRG